MFHFIGVIVILVPAAFGCHMLFASADRLFAGVAWMRLPMPAKGTGPYRLLLGFWRGIGVVAILCSLFFAYILFAHGR